MTEGRELREYKNAVWDYILEHCDIMPGGTIFVKFHTKGKTMFEGHINSRISGYHRGNPRTSEYKHEANKKQHELEKKKKHEMWKAGQAERRKIMDEVKRKNEIKQAHPILKLKLFIKRIINGTTMRMR